MKNYKIFMTMKMEKYIHSVAKITHRSEEYYFAVNEVESFVTNSKNDRIRFYYSLFCSSIFLLQLGMET